MFIVQIHMPTSFVAEEFIGPGEHTFLVPEEYLNVAFSAKSLSMTGQVIRCVIY